MKEEDYYQFLLYIKMSDRTNHYQKNRDRTLNGANKYYEKTKKD